MIQLDLSATTATAISRVVRLSNDTIVGTTPEEGTRLVVIGPDGRAVRSRPSAFPAPATVPDDQKRRALDAGVGLCGWPSRGFVLVNFDIGRVEYYDLSAEFVRVANVPFPTSPEFAPEKQPDGSMKIEFVRDRHHYLSCTVARDRLFALFSGRSIRDVATVRNRGAQGEFLHEFNWQGDLLRVLALDEPVLAIDADPEDDMFYATSIANGTILRFVVPPAGGS